MYPVTASGGARMAELVNLRMARKRAKQRQEEREASVNRLAHGQPKHWRKLAAAKNAKTGHDLDQHQIDKGGSR
jgi:hypothetical protein